MNKDFSIIKLHQYKKYLSSGKISTVKDELDLNDLIKLMKNTFRFTKKPSQTITISDENIYADNHYNHEFYYGKNAFYVEHDKKENNFIFVIRLKDDFGGTMVFDCTANNIIESEPYKNPNYLLSDVLSSFDYAWNMSQK